MMGSRGFSLVELLVALTVCALLSGAIAAVTPQARAAFDATPEALELQQRVRTAVDVLAIAVRSAALLAADRDDGTAGEPVAAVDLSEPDEADGRFHVLRVVAPAGPGRGVLASDQAGSSGALRLKPDAVCPSVGEVCGFVADGVAAIVDVDGGYDVFTIAATSKGANSISPASALSRAYPSGSALFEVSADTYYLDQQPDASFSLVRETAAGAVQPIVDHVLAFAVTPWRPAAVLHRVDIEMQIGARVPDPRRHVPARARRLSISLRNPS
mgnify:CR=1 FL=1